MEMLLTTSKVVLVIAAITTTLFPALYAFVPWWRSMLGRSMMAQSLALALILDLSVLFQFFITPSSQMFLLWLNIVILVIIAITSACLCFVQLRFLRERRTHNANRKQGV